MKSIIIIEDLPLRAKRLNDEEISGLYGGCAQRNYSCKKNKDCCDGMKCQHTMQWHGDWDSAAMWGGFEGGKSRCGQKF